MSTPDFARCMFLPGVCAFVIAVLVYGFWPGNTHSATLVVVECVVLFFVQVLIGGLMLFPDRRNCRNRSTGSKAQYARILGEPTSDKFKGHWPEKGEEA